MHDARDDHADAALIVDVAAALRRWRGRTNKRPATKILRETVWFYWQNPRLERPRVAGKYPRGVPWSEAAASLVLSGVARNDRLVIEHVEPMNRVLRWLINDAPGPEELIAALPDRLRCVVVTTEQAASLPDEGSPAERYAEAGLSLDDFKALGEWECLFAGVGPAIPPELADVSVGDVRWDFMGRQWTVVEMLPDGLKIEHPDEGTTDLTWHALLTIGALRAPLPAA